MSIENPTILLVNADESLLTVLSYNLERYGFVVRTAKNGNMALSIAEQMQLDLIVLDDNIDKLQGENNLSVVSLIPILKNKTGNQSIPVIIISENIQKYSTQQNNAEITLDFIQKPFMPSKLVSMIKNIFNKTKPHVSSKYLEYKDLKMNIGTYKVTRSGRNVHLGPTEFKILQCLMEFPSKILSREYIMTQVWGQYSNVEPRTIDVHINRLRAALKNDNESDADVPLIKTVRSAGYCLSNSGD